MTEALFSSLYFRVQVWDTAGQGSYLDSAAQYYKEGAAAIVVYDVTNLWSFERAKRWVTELRTEGPPDIVIALAGNKTDLLSREVTYENASIYAGEHNMPFMEISSKTGHNVNTLFSVVFSQIKLNKLKVRAESIKHKKELIQNLSKIRSAVYKGRDLCELFTSQFKCKTLGDAILKCSGVQEQVCAMILKLLFPERTEQLQALTNISLKAIRTPNDILHYLDALIKSGISTQTQQGLLFVLGNTSVGKTSFVNLIHKYFNDPSGNPESFLTQDNPGLLKTRILEIYSNILLDASRTVALNLEEQSSNIVFIKSHRKQKSEARVEKCSLKIVDMGGHLEYYACSKLFIASQAIFLICFDSTKMSGKKEEWDGQYYSMVGTYVDLIMQAASSAGTEPKIVIVATKVDSLKSCNEAADCILELTKKHLSGLQGLFQADQGVFLLNEVISVSSLKTSKRIMDGIYETIVSLCVNQELQPQSKTIVPFSWFKLLDNIRQHKLPSVSLQQIEEEFTEVEANVEGEPNISRSDLKNLRILRSIVEVMHEADANTKVQDINASVEVGDCNVAELSEISSVDSMTELLTPLVTQTPEEEVVCSSKNIEQQLRSRVEPILDFFSGLGEILWFKEIQTLRNIVITIPMELINSLRLVINHEVTNALKKKDNLNAEQSLLERGIISYADMKTIHDKAVKEAKNPPVYTVQEIWNFLIQLNLACNLDDRVDRDDGQIFVPSLISDKMEKDIRDIEREMKQDNQTICVQYMSDINKDSNYMFYKLLSNFTKYFIWGQKGGDFDLAFCQKIENRSIGMVGAIYGRLKWVEEDIQNPENYKFLIAEYEDDFSQDESISSAIHKALRIYLKKSEGNLSPGSIEVLMELDKYLTADMTAVSREVMCKECLRGGARGAFSLTENFQLSLGRSLCSGRGRYKHHLDTHIKTNFETKKEKKPFSLDKLMRKEKESLQLETFSTSSIKNRIETGQMEVGEQIWIYHDGETNPWNPVAVRNPYAHVVIYVGASSCIEKGRNHIVHEVVHVTKDSWRGVMKATIARENIEKVIKHNDQVFLGHQIDGRQFAGNIRKKIAERAIACLDPKIVFNYDHRSVNEIKVGTNKQFTAQVKL